MTAAARDRVAGIALFSFIPMTLWLMLRLPAGIGPSLLGAAAVIASHRQIASRWVRGTGSSRCLWCGGATREAVAVELRKAPRLAVCSRHQEALDRFLAFAHAARWPLRAGILLPVAAYFLLGFAEALGVAEALGHSGLPPLALRKTLFRLVVASAVMAVALLHRLAPPRRPDAFPFPIHNLALLGVRATLAVFVLVGTFWLGLSTWELLRA